MGDTSLVFTGHPGTRLVGQSVICRFGFITALVVPISQLADRIKEVLQQIAEPVFKKGLESSMFHFC